MTSEFIWIWTDNSTSQTNPAIGLGVASGSQFGETKIYIDNMIRTNQKLQFEFADYEEKKGKSSRVNLAPGIKATMVKDEQSFLSQYSDRQLDETAKGMTSDLLDGNGVAQLISFAAAAFPQVVQFVYHNSVGGTERDFKRMLGSM